MASSRWYRIASAVLFAVTLAIHAVLTRGADTVANVGTWTQIKPTLLSTADRAIAYNSDGDLPDMCDHSTVSLGGGKLWTSFGSNDVDPTGEFFLGRDAWILDTTTDPPSWHIEPTTNWVQDRTGAMAAYNFKQNKIFVFGGYSYFGTDTAASTYLDDVVVLDLNTHTWNILIPSSPNHISNAGPVGRGWSEAIWTNATNPRYLLLYGGSCSLDGQALSPHAHDCDDTWLFDTESHVWIGSRNEGPCTLAAPATCSDARALTAMVSGPNFGQLLANFTTILSDPTTRPGGAVSASQTAYDLGQMILAQLNATAAFLRANGTLTTNLPDVTACTAGCAQYFSESNYTRDGQPYFVRPALVNGTPKRLEGSRTQCVDDKCYMFGGYSCLADGVLTAVGPVCYQSIMYVYSLTTAKWSAIEKPLSPTDPQYLLWPGPRAYHTSTLHKRKLWVFGGGYVDQAFTKDYYADMHVFNIDTLLWEPLTVRGQLPPIRWSHTMTKLDADDSRLWLIGGCVAPLFSYHDVWTFTIGLTIVPSNVFAMGPGIQSAFAGVQSEFYIQTYDFIANGTGVIRGPNLLTWGTGLPLSVSIVGTHAGESVLVNGDVSEVGDGRYVVTYLASRGVTLEVFISLDGTAIPGSPFRVPLIPSRPSGQLSSTRGVGLQGAVRTSTAQFTIVSADQYGNPMTSGGFSANLSVALVAGVNDAPPLTYVISDNLDGTYTIDYDVPDLATFQLEVTLNDQPVLNSPFTVVGYLDPVVSTNTLRGSIALTTIGLIIVAAMIVTLIVKRENPSVRAGSPLYMILMLFGGMIGLASIFLLLEVTDGRCRAFPFMFGIGFMALISALYGKLYRVKAIFAQQKVKRVKLSDRKLAFFPLVCVMFDILYNIIWVASDPMKATRVYGADGFTSFLVCDCNHFGVWSGVSYVYHALFLLYGVFLASATVAVPNAFNESRLLATTLYNSAVSGLAIPILYVFIEDPASAYSVKFAACFYSIMFACLVMVGPRIYYVIFPPPKEFFAMNTKASAGGSGASGTTGGGSGGAKPAPKAVELTEMKSSKPKSAASPKIIRTTSTPVTSTEGLTAGASALIQEEFAGRAMSPSGARDRPASAAGMKVALTNTNESSSPTNRTHPATSSAALAAEFVVSVNDVEPPSPHDDDVAPPPPVSGDQ